MSHSVVVAVAPVVFIVKRALVDNSLCLIYVVVQHRAGLLLGWVTVCGM